MTTEEILKEAESYLRTEVGSKANLIDADCEALRTALQGLCDRNLMALKRAPEYGGPGVDEVSFRTFQESVARYSGSLAFLQTQHQSAVNMLGKCENEGLKQRMLPKMGDGTLLVGIGFSQLRRSGNPIMKAEHVEGGYRLNGTVPWITGQSFFHEVLIGAALPDGRGVFGIVPFHDTAEMKHSEPMKLAAMESARTVSADYVNYFLPESEVLYVKPADWIHNNDMINITLQGFFALGCARAGLDIVNRCWEAKRSPAIQEAWQSLDREISECREKLFQAQSPIPKRLSTRAWAIELAVRCAHAGITATGGSANSVTNDAQRVYREALVYTVSAQTAPIMEATLSRLTRR